LKTILIFFLCMASMVSIAGDIQRFCFRIGDINEDVCSVSLSTLIARGEDFDGKLVEVTGFYAHADIPVLFSTKDSFMSSNVADGLGVKIPSNVKIASRLFELNHSTITLIGRFGAKPIDTSRYSGYQTGGRLYDIRTVGPAFAPWGYSEPQPYGLPKHRLIQ
jgi:hypothetical protein